MGTLLRRRLSLARRVLDAQWFQPATAIWRLFETEAVREHLSATGQGLDVGCGDGLLAPVLLERAGPCRWTGLDLDPREVILARRSGAYRRLAAASAEDLPFRTGSFDLVFSNSALEHMSDVERVLAEAARVLRPGGRLVFTVPSADFHRALAWPGLLRRLARAGADRRYVEHLDRRLRHLRYPTLDAWREMLGRHGLEVRRTAPYLGRRACGAWETLSNLTGGVVHRLQRGRPAPREVQLRAGLRPAPSRVLGALAFGLLLPVLVWICVDRRPGARAGLYVEARFGRGGARDGEAAS